MLDGIRDFIENKPLLTMFLFVVSVVVVASATAGIICLQRKVKGRIRQKPSNVWDEPQEEPEA